MNMSKIVIKVTETSNPDFSFQLDIVRTGVFSTLMMLALSAMTVDRAVFVKLNLKYKWELASTAAKVAIIDSALISLPITMAMFLTQTTKEELNDLKVLYYWPIYDAFVIVVFVICYASMIHTIKKTSKNLFRIESDIYKNRMRKATIVPKLIIISFIIFWASADFINLGLYLAEQKPQEWVEIALNVITCTAYSTDAVFYIYFCRPIRRALKKKFLWMEKKKSKRKKNEKQDVCVINGAR